MKNIFFLIIVIISNAAFAVSYTTEVYCLDEVSRLSYGASGNNIKIEKGALINVLDKKTKLKKQIDLKKGECEIRTVAIPDPYEG